MPTPVIPDSQFLHLNEQEIIAALDDENPENPIACEVARLIQGYVQNFSALADRLGRTPASILRRKPESAIEAVAMRLTTQALQDAVAQRDA